MTFHTELSKQNTGIKLQNVTQIAASCVLCQLSTVSRANDKTTTNWSKNDGDRKLPK